MVELRRDGASLHTIAVHACDDPAVRDPTDCSTRCCGAADRLR